MVASQFITLLLQHIIEDLEAQEKFLILLLEVLFAEDLKCFLVGEGLTGEWIAELGDRVGDWAHQGDWTVCSGISFVDRLQGPITSLNVAIRMEYLLLVFC